MPTKNDLTEEDISMLKYFWEEKQDIERYSKFEKIKPILEEKYPHILKCWNDYKHAIKTFELVIKDL